MTVDLPSFDLIGRCQIRTWGFQHEKGFTMRNRGCFVALLLGTSATLAGCSGGGGSGGMAASRAGNAPADQVLASAGSAASVAGSVSVPTIRKPF